MAIGYLYQIKANPQVEKYLEEMFVWSLSNHNVKAGVADRLVDERKMSEDEIRGGFGP